MALAQELSSRLDVTAAVGVFTGSLTEVNTDLDGVSIPAPTGEMDSASGAAASVNLSGIAPSVGQAASSLTGLIGGLGPVNDALQPFTSALELVEGLTSADIETKLTAMVARLSGALEGGSRSDGLSSFEGLASGLSGSAELGVLRGLLDSVLGAAGVRLPADALKLPDFATAIPAAARVIGAMMALHTTLSEAARLADVTGAQFEAAEFERRAQSALALAGALSAILSGTDVTNAAQLDAARLALENCSKAVGGLLDYAETGMGFGEATVVYLDPARMETEVALAAQIVRETDLAPVERCLADLFAKLGPVLRPDLSAFPSRPLDQFFTDVEAEVASLADSIRTFDLSEITGPVTDVLDKIASVPRALHNAIDEAVASIQAALEKIRVAVAAVPLGQVADALRQALQPIADALAAIGSLIEAIREALEAAVTQLQAALDKAEAAVDSLKATVEAAFQDAADFIDSLNLDQVLGQVTSNVQGFAALIESAQMKPYFETAVDAIDTATEVIEKVPFELLPDSMESEVVAVLKPIKETDIGAIESEIESILQIGPDGKFQLRPEIEQAITAIQEKYDALIQTLVDLDPRGAAAALDTQLSSLAQRIQEISPSVELAPVQEALDRLREAVGSFDLDAVIEPVRQGFDQLLATIDQYNPAQLIVPLETRVDEARAKLVDAMRLREAVEKLELIETEAAAALDRLDPSRLEGFLVDGLNLVQQSLEVNPNLRLGAAVGTVFSAIVSGSGLRANPASFDMVIAWSGNSGSSELTGYTGRTSAGIGKARDEVRAVNPRGVAAQFTPLISAARSAIQGLPAGPERDSLSRAVDRLDPAARLGRVSANHDRYKQLLESAAGYADRVSRIGLSEVDVASARLRASIAPVSVFTQLLDTILDRMGLVGTGLGLKEIVQRLLAAAPPQRLAAIVSPIVLAIRDRILAVLNSLLTPVKNAINDVLGFIDAFDLTPFRESVDSIYQAARDQIEAFHPDQILGEVLTAFRNAQQEVAGFNPLEQVTAALTALRDSVARVLSKLKASEIFATPIELYEEIVGLLGQLDVQSLLAPVLEAIDSIAAQVDQGLDDTVTAFQRLQDALPDSVGSTSLSASVSVST